MVSCPNKEISLILFFKSHILIKLTNPLKLFYQNLILTMFIHFFLEVLKNIIRNNVILFYFLYQQLLLYHEKRQIKYYHLFLIKIEYIHNSLLLCLYISIFYMNIFIVLSSLPEVNLSSDNNSKDVIVFKRPDIISGLF